MLKSPPAAILFIWKCFIQYLTAVSIFTHQYLICWDAIFLDLIPLGFELPLIVLQLRANNALIDPFASQVGGLRYGKDVFLIYTKLWAYGTTMRVVRIRLIGWNKYGSLGNELPWLFQRKCRRG